MPNGCSVTTFSETEWEAALARCPATHVLQTAAWGALKSAFGWSAVRIVEGNIGAQVLFRRLSLGLSLAYLPKGPLDISTGFPVETESAAWQAFLPALDKLCRRENAVFLKIEPDLWQTAVDLPSAPPGFRSSRQAIQPPRTLLVDLTGGEEHILARMKQKTRYNIRLALKKGVVVYPSSDIDTFHRLMLTTSERDRFGVHSLEYYRRAYDLFNPRGECELLFAEFEGRPLAALMAFARGSRAWYFYGASSDAHRDLMPTYLLQWEAMRWARTRGCTSYDLWGVPDEDEQILEAQFADRSDGLWGVYRFKRGFGGELRRTRGPWDRVYNPLLYSLYYGAFYRPWWLRRRQMA